MTSLRSALLLAAVTLALTGSVSAQTPPRTETATFAGGCFWCVESDFDHVNGVISTTSGYTGGRVKNPTYEEVSAGGTGHTEAVQIIFDPAKVSYADLLKVFWRSIDPTTKDKQFCDVGDQYRTAIFYHDDGQKRLLEQSRAELDRTKPFKASIATQIAPAATFYPAEDYHQDFHTKNPVRYKFYRFNCGRDKRLAELWGGAR